MPIAIDGSRVPGTLTRMPCGGVPHFDNDSGYAYRCDTCFAVLGSVGQSNQCKELNKDYKGDAPSERHKLLR